MQGSDKKKKRKRESYYSFSPDEFSVSPSLKRNRKFYSQPSLPIQKSSDNTQKRRTVVDTFIVTLIEYGEIDRTITIKGKLGLQSEIEVSDGFFRIEFDKKDITLENIYIPISETEDSDGNVFRFSGLVYGASKSKRESGHNGKNYCAIFAYQYEYQYNVKSQTNDGKRPPPFYVCPYCSLEDLVRFKDLRDGGYHITAKNNQKAAHRDIEVFFENLREPIRQKVIMRRENYEGMLNSAGLTLIEVSSKPSSATPSDSSSSAMPSRNQAGFFSAGRREDDETFIAPAEQSLVAISSGSSSTGWRDTVPYTFAAQPFMGQQFVAQPFMAQQLVAQPFMAQQLVAQPFMAQQLAGQPFMAQQLAGQPFMAQQLAAQQYGMVPVTTLPLVTPSAEPFFETASSRLSSAGSIGNHQWEAVSEAMPSQNSAGFFSEARIGCSSSSSSLVEPMKMSQNQPGP